MRAQLHHHFRPEFLNRVDDIVVFRTLGEEELRHIVRLQLGRVSRLAEDLGVSLEVTEEAMTFLAREGFDPAFGARPLKRAIQRFVQDPLALYLLDEEVAAGTRIVVRPAAEGERLAFEPVSPAVLASAEGSPTA